MKTSRNNLLLFLICLIWVSLASCAEVKEDEELKPGVEEYPVKYIKVNLRNPERYIANQKPLFTWDRNAEVPQDRRISYTFQLSYGDKDFNNIVLEKKNLTGTSYQIEDALEEVKYYWRVGTTVDGKFEVWSDFMEFTVDTTVPVLHDALIIKWDDTTDAKTYITVDQLDVADAWNYQITATDAKPSIDSSWNRFSGNQIVHHRNHTDKSIKGFLWLKDRAGNISNSIYITSPVIRSFTQNINTQSGVLELIAEVENGSEFVITDESDPIALDDPRWKSLAGSGVLKQYDLPVTPQSVTLWVKDTKGNLSYPKELTIGSQESLLQYFPMDNRSSVPDGSCFLNSPPDLTGNSGESNVFDADIHYFPSLKNCLSRTVCRTVSESGYSCDRGSGIAAQGVEYVKQANEANTSLKFDQRGDFFAFTGVGNYYNAQEDMTLSFWFNVRDFSKISDHTPILLGSFFADLYGFSDFDHYNSLSKCLVCIRSASNPAIGVYGQFRKHYNESSYTYIELTSYSTTKVTTDQWYHVVVQQEGPKARLYLNGKMIMELPKKGYITSEAFAFSRTFRYYPGKEASYFIGEIDEVTLFNSAFDPAEIELMHNMEKLRFQ